MSDNNSNINILQNCQISQSPQFINNTAYNPFAPNQNSNNNFIQNNSHPEYQQNSRPYLNEIKNEGPKNINLNNKETSNSINNNSELNNPIIKNSQSNEIKTNYEMAMEFENAIRQEIEQTTPLISEKLNIQILLDDYKSNE